MADTMDNIATARAQGYSDDEIVNFLSAKDPTMGPKIKQAQDSGYASTDIVSHLVSKLPAASKAPKDATEIENNPTWAQRGKILYKEANGEDFKGDDKGAAKWLGDYVYDFNHRLINVGSNKDGGRGTLDIGYNVQRFSPEAKKAFVDSQHDYENMGLSWKGAGKTVERILTDPFTYATLGVGKLASKLFQKGATETVEQLAQRGIAQGAKQGLVTGAGEGAVYGGGLDAANQTGMINAGGQDSYDPVRGAEAAGMGALAGGALGGTAGAVGGAMEGRAPRVQAARQLVDNPEDAKLGAEVTQRLKDVQDTRGSTIGLADANASLNAQKEDLLANVRNLDLPKDQVRRITSNLTNAKGLTESDMTALQGVKGGQEIIDNIGYMKKFRDMTAPLPSSSNFAMKALRVGADQLPFAPLRLAARSLLKGGKTGTEVIQDAISPKKLDIAQNVLDLGGRSQASIGRDSLSSMASDTIRAQKSLKDAAEQAKGERIAAKRDRALQAVQNNDPPVPDSPQGVMESATGFDRNQTARALRIIERTRPALQSQVDQYRESVATGGRIEDLNALIRAVRKLSNDGTLVPKNVANSGDQVMATAMGQPTYSPAHIQGTANQARVTAVIDRVAKSGLPDAQVEAINSAASKIGTTNNQQEAMQHVLDLMGNLSDPKARAVASRELKPLVDQIRHKTPK
jgi:hypothetical protein